MGRAVRWGVLALIGANPASGFLQPHALARRTSVRAAAAGILPTDVPQQQQCSTLVVPFSNEAASQFDAAQQKKDHSLLVLHRSLPEAILRGLGALAFSAHPFKAEAVASATDDVSWLDHVTRPLLEGTTAQPRDHLPAWDWLRRDLVDVHARFARAVGAETGANPQQVAVAVKAEVLEKGKCPRFHVDKVPLRLLCTYVGPGTEWLQDQHTDWNQLRHNRQSAPACNEAISRGHEAMQAGPGSVLLLRGMQPRRGQRGVAHRSPDMGEGERRLVTTMDIA